MKAIVDFDNPKEAAIFHKGTRLLRGKKRIEILNYRPRRSDRQNNAYWDMVCEPFADWLTIEWGEPFTKEDAHDQLRRQFLRKDCVHPVTGEVAERVRSTTELDTAEFSEYFDRCRDLLAQMCGIIVEDPDPAWRARVPA